MKLDATSVIVGLLQSILYRMDDAEDKEIVLQEIEDLVGANIASLVQGVANLHDILSAYSNTNASTMDSSHQGETERYRNMMLAMAQQDIRVVLVKLADQAQRVRLLATNSRNDDVTPTNKNATCTEYVARETLDLYAPLAHRLGINKLKTELEDNSLRYGHPEAYESLRALVSIRQAQRQEYTDRTIQFLYDRLAEEGVLSQAPTTNHCTSSSSNNSSNSEHQKQVGQHDPGIAVTGRAKSLYSIYQKMQLQNLALEGIQHLIAFRILVDDLSQWYQALGIVNSQWKPVHDRFKDYIASPKPNGYASLHTTVVGPEGKRIEVPIRTHDLHRIAEGGIAAHWAYKNSDGSIKGSSTPKGTSEQETQRYK